MESNSKCRVEGCTTILRKTNRSGFCVQHKVRNKEKANAAQKAYRARHLEKIKAKNRAYDELHREENNARSKAWREANPQRAIANRQSYKERNPEKWLEQSTRWYKNHPEKVKNRDLKYNYGITLEQWHQMATEQGYRCALCDEEKKLYVDHCHKSGSIRKLLCNTCNTFIGKLEKDKARLEKALEYIGFVRTIP